MRTEESRPLALAITTEFSTIVTLSRAETLRMPFASISKITSTLACSRLARSMPSMTNSPSCVLPSMCERSPS